MSGSTIDRAELFHDLGRYPQAAELAARHLAGQPDDTRALILLARCQRSMGDLNAALATVEEALRLEPDDAYPWMVRADTLSKLGRLQEAVAAARRAVELAPLFWGSHHALAVVLERSGNRALRTDAYAVARHATSLAPEEASAHFMVGLIAQRLGDLRTARTAYETTLRLDPQSSEAHNNLAMLDQRRSAFNPRAWTRAAEGFVNSAALDVEDTYARYNLEGMAWGVAASARWVALAGMFVSMVSTYGLRSGSPEADGYSGPLIGGLLLVLMWSGWLLWQRGRISHRVRGPLLMIARRCPPVLAMAAAVAMLALHSVAAVALPLVDPPIMGGLAGLLFWNLILTYWISRVFLGRRSPVRRQRRTGGAG
ncbi:tetratricopeptide repeat protein [Streptomyces bambusae]|uniref:Tetratricopeptide repeat protein n=1 Tax=Streptomyces bambusae TaxID=1550616 RepID=A0ABS6ZBN9_9ACTN|nr:tetratricopeptide repeat protein [Streptomyces bambusae]MBW5485172.1 tetratricopeptide repeat protein [Streptomyces bambusae]